MNAQSSLSLLCAVGVLTGSTSSLTAGFGVRRVAEQRTPVALTALDMVDFSQTRRNVAEVLQSIPGVQLSQSDQDKLQRLPQFRGLDEAGVNSQFAAYNLLTANAITAIAAGDDDVANTLGGMYHNGQVSISCAVNFYTDSESRIDGNPLLAGDAININYLPDRLAEGQSEYPLYSPEGFRFMNNLAREGGRTRYAGYSGPPPQTADEKATFGWTLFNQNYGTGLAEVARYEGAIDAMDGILNNFQIPATVDPVSAVIGNQLLGNPQLTQQEILGHAGELKAYLAVNHRLAEADLEYNELGRAATALFLDGKFPEVGSAYELTKLPKNWAFSWPQTTGPYSYVGIGGGGGRIDETDPDNPFTIGYNRVWQVGGQSDGTIVDQDFTVPEVDYLSAGYYKDGRLTVVGWSVSEQLSYGIGYRDTNNDGLVEPETKEPLFTTPMFSHGLQLVYNEGRDELVGFDLGTRNLYRLGTPNQNGFFTTFHHQGGLGSERLEINEVGFNEQGDWAVGVTLGFKYSWQDFGFAVEARYSDADEEFVNARLSYRPDEVYQNPAVAEALIPGYNVFRGTGTPDTEYHLYKMELGGWTSIGNAQSDPYGRFFMESTETLQIGGHVRLGNEELGEWSPVYKVPDFSGDLKLQDPKIYGGNFKANYFHIPGTDVAIDRRDSLEDDWQLGTLRTVLALGFGNARILNAVLGAEGYFRGRIVPKGPQIRPQYYLVPPTAVFSLFPAWNAFFAYNQTQFALTSNQFDERYLTTPGMASLTSRLFAIANPFGNGYSLEYRLQMENFANLLNAMYVLPDYGKVLRPVVEYNEFGEEVVYINCFVINEEYYPVVQFWIRPFDNCLFFHWHSPFARVYHLDNDQTGLTDPDPPFCGFGALGELLIQRVEVPYAIWNDFRRGDFELANLPTF